MQLIVSQGKNQCIWYKTLGMHRKLCRPLSYYRKIRLLFLTVNCKKKKKISSCGCLWAMFYNMFASGTEHMKIKHAKSSTVRMHLIQLNTNLDLDAVGFMNFLLMLCYLKSFSPLFDCRHLQSPKSTIAVLHFHV